MRLLLGLNAYRILFMGILCLIAGYILGNVLPFNRAVRPNELGYISNGYKHIVDLQSGKDTNIGSPGSNDLKSSPDGVWIASWTYQKKSKRWLLELLSTSAWKRQSLGEFEIAFPTLSWSPDSMQIAFAAVPDGMENTFQNHELFLINRETLKIQRLTDNHYEDSMPDFSPDGRLLAYKSTEDGFNHLYILDIAKGEHHLVSDKTYAYAPVWSPDGKQIAFGSNHEGPNDAIYIIDADGQNLRRVSFNDATDELPFWLP